MDAAIVHEICHAVISLFALLGVVVIAWAFFRD